MVKNYKFWILNGIYLILILVSTCVLFDAFITPIMFIGLGALTVITWIILSIVMLGHLDYVNTFLGVSGAEFNDPMFEKANAQFNKLLQDQKESHEEVDQVKTTFLSKESELKKVLSRYQSLETTLEELKKAYMEQEKYFEEIANMLPQRIWVSNVRGEILFGNTVFNSVYKDVGYLKEVLKIDANGSDLFTIRDFGNIQYHFSNGEVLTGKSIRIFHEDTVRVILHLSNPSDFDKRMNKNYLRKTRDLHVINEIGKIIIGRSTIVSTLQEALNKIAFLNNLNSISVRLLNQENDLEMIALSGYSSKYVLKDKIRDEKLHMRYALNENRMIFLNHKDDFLFPEPELESFLMEGGKIAYIPLANYNSTFGILSIASDYEFNTENLTLYEAISINLTIALEKILLYDQLKSNYFKTVEAFVTATEINSSWFSGHSRRVAEICKEIAQQLYLSAEEVDEIYMSGLLHDVGKMSSVLTGKEDQLLEEHSKVGRELVEKVGLSKDVLDGIEFHHVDYDMNNMHDPMFTEQPYFAQIIRIANDLDWLMNESESGFTLEQAVLEMKKSIGSKYADQFIRILESIIRSGNANLNKLYSRGYS